MTQQQDPKDLKMQALKERLATHVSNYEEAIADLRTNYTLMAQQVEAKDAEINNARAEVEALEAERNVLTERIAELEAELSARPKRTTRKQKEDTAE